MKSTGAVTVLFALLFGAKCQKNEDCRGNKVSPYFKLHSCITGDYDSSVLPVKDPATAVDVNVTFTVRYISMDEMENVLNVHVFLEITWMDQFIKWDPAAYGGIKNTVVSGGVWVPDLQVYNDRMYWKGQSNIYVYDVHVYNTGLMYAVSQGEIVAHCNLDTYKWPFDRHRCMAYVGSTNYFGNQMRINFGKQRVKTNMYLNSSVWELEDVQAKRVNFTTRYGNGTKYEYLRFDTSFTVRRYSSALFATISAPVLSCIFLTLGSLWIDPQQMTRLICILTSIVLQTSMLQYLGDKLPTNASKGVLILILLRDSLVISFLAFVVAIVNRHLQHFKTTPPHSFTSLIAKVTSAGRSQFLLLPDESATSAADDEVTLVKTTNKFKHEWVLITCLIDRLAFFLFLIIYIILFLVYTSI